MAHHAAKPAPAIAWGIDTAGKVIRWLPGVSGALDAASSPS
ncbi:hypothetical protein [Desulfotruncus arcticus]|nr:hypothetical protein [Desulfotruncus arcticus]